MARRRSFISTWEEYIEISTNAVKRKKQLLQLITQLLTALTLPKSGVKVVSYTVENSIDLAKLENDELVDIFHKIDNDRKNNIQPLLDDIWDELDHRGIDPHY